MRRIALHRADAEVDARLAEIHRLKLRVGIGEVQHAGIAEALDIVNARIIFGGLRANAWQAAGQGGGARQRQEIAAADGHAGLRAS